MPLRLGAVSAAALLAGLAANAPGTAQAAQACGNFVTGQHYFTGTVSATESCLAPAGTYMPTPTTGVLAFTDTGYGLLAVGASKLGAYGPVTVVETNTSSAAVGAGELSVLTLTNGATINVSGAYSSGVQTLNGGQVTIGAVGVATSVTNTSALGFNGADMSATTVGALITANNVNSSFAFSGGGVGVFADQNAAINVNGGSINSTGNFVVNAAAWDRATLTLSGASLTASGNGGNTLWASNGGKVDGTSLTISSPGGSYQASTGTILSGGATNNAYGTTSTGGVLNLTTSSITAAGYGVYTANGGVTTLTGDTIKVTGAGGYGVQSAAGSQTAILGGSVTVNGANAPGLRATGAGAAIDVSFYNGAPLTITMNAANGAGAKAEAGGAITFTGGAINVASTATSTAGVYATGAGSKITATGTDAAAFQITNAGANGAGARADSGGVVTLTGANINLTSSATNAAGVIAAAGGTVNLNGGSVTTAGANTPGLYATGAGASLNTAVSGGVGVSVSTSGANATGAQADGGGVLTLNGGSVAVSGAGSLGLYATGENSQITANNVAVSTSGGGLANAALAASGAVLTMNGGSAQTSGLDSYVAGAVSGGTINLTGTAISSTSQGGGGLFANGSTAAVTGDNLTITITGAYDAANQFHPAGVDNQSFQSFVGGGTIKLTDSIISVTSDNGDGVFTDNSGATSIKGGSIATTGANSGAVYDWGASTTTLTDVQITTKGVGAKGIDVNGTGSTLTGSGLTISTSGGTDANNNKSVGVYNGNGGGDGGGATGGGKITLTNSNITTSGYYAFGVATLNGGATTLTGGSIQTSGTLGDGVYSSSSGATQLSDLTIATTGDGAKGISIHGTGTTLTGDNLTISTAGARDASTTYAAQGVYNGSGPSPNNAGNTGGGTITLTNSTVVTSGAGGYGVDTENGGKTTLTGGSVSTKGAEADAILALGGSTVTLSGVTLAASGNASKGIDVLGTGTTLTGLNLTISTSGIVDPATGVGVQGVYNGNSRNPGAQSTGGGAVTLTDSSVTTSGVGATGVQTANSGVTQLFGGSITTAGAKAVGLLAQSGASVTAGLDTAGNATVITTRDVSAFGAQALGGATLTLNGTQIATSGNGAAGLVVNDAATNVTATNVTITTKGGMDASTGFYAHGVFNGPGSGTSGGTLTLNNANVSASGADASAVATSTGGATTINRGSFSTSGGAATISVVDTGSVQINGATVSSSGEGSAISVSGAGARLTGSNLTIGASGAIIAVFNGATGSYDVGGVVRLIDSVVKTVPVASDGVDSENKGTTTFLGGSISTSSQGTAGAAAIDGGLLKIGLDSAGVGTVITTTGAGSVGLGSRTAGSVLTVEGASILSTGDGSSGLDVTAGGELDATNVNVVTTGGYDPDSGRFSYGAANASYGPFSGSGVLTLTNSTISTTGQGAYGVYAGPNSTTTITGGSISTSGDGAHAIYASGAGANVAANGVAISTSGAAAFGAYVSGGASLSLGANTSITTTGAGSIGVNVSGAGSTATIADNVAISVGAGSLALSADSGGAIVTKGALTLRSAGTALFLSGGASTGTITFGGPLNITTTSAASPAVLMIGDNASFNGASGGSINAAGVAFSLLNGVNQSATFVNYAISNASGDLFFADPTTTTLNFTNTTLNAGAGNLFDATAGSTITANVSGSTLTGAVATDATSTTNANLTNNSTLTLTGDSTISNLSLANSALGFSAPVNGAFKTLTVTNYTGSNAAVTLNAALGPNGGADQIVVNGGRASGTTTLTVKPVGTSGATTGLGVPLVTTANGGTIAPGAFTLNGPLVSNGYLYTLQAQGSGDYLVSNTTQTPQQAAASVAALSQSRQTQAVTSKVLGSILTGATEQINCSSCQSGFASFGSFALGVHGRWTLSPTLALLAGGSYDSYSGRGVTVNNSMQVALALRYDAVNLGKYRPFLEAGVSAQPWASVTYSRAYASALGGGVGTGTALSRAVGVYGRIGYIWRLTRTDEAAVYADLTRSWDSTSGYTETATPGNPNGAVVAPTLDTLNVWRAGAQYTHLFGQHIEGNISGGFAQAFGANYGTTAALGGFGDATASAPSGFHWWEVGGRVSYRFSKIVTGDLFLLGTLGAQPVGEQLHGGAALRMAF